MFYSHNAPRLLLLVFRLFFVGWRHACIDVHIKNRPDGLYYMCLYFPITQGVGG